MPDSLFHPPECVCDDCQDRRRLSRGTERPSFESLEKVRCPYCGYIETVSDTPAAAWVSTCRNCRRGFDVIPETRLVMVCEPLTNQGVIESRRRLGIDLAPVPDGKVRLVCGVEVDYDTPYGRGGGTHCETCREESLAVAQRRRQSEGRIYREKASSGNIEGIPFIASKIPPGKVRGATATPVSASDLGGVKDPECMKCGDTGQVLKVPCDACPRGED